MIHLDMPFLTTALISLPLSSADARTMGIAGATAEEQSTHLEAKFKAKGYNCRVGDQGLPWMVDGFYIYIITENPRVAESIHKHLDKFSERLDGGVVIPTTWRLRQNEKYLDCPPSKGELLALTNK